MAADLARNPSASAGILTQLDRSAYVVRSGLSSHVNTPAALLAELAGDTSAEIRAHVAEHPNTPVRTLTGLCVDRDEAVSSRAQHNRVRMLHMRAQTYPPQQKTHAQLLLDNDFPGWPDDLDRVVGYQPVTLAARHVHTARSRLRTRA